VPPVVQVTPTPTPTPVPTSTPRPTPTPTPELTPEPEELEIDDDNTPLAESERTSAAWALVNLILAVAGIVLAIITAVRALLRKRDKYEEYNYEINRAAENEEYQKKIRVVCLTVAMIMALAGIILFFITEDMRLPMVLVDRWTIVNAVIFIIEVIAVLFVFKKKKPDDDRDSDMARQNSLQMTN